ncbi:tRNA1(Val) (adenine(37)-N6)-methyltransferase [Aquabacter sp. L1I39]|uniref:tRNA1(Val) (adenine(37)-N6)-methyltransferase n=1 Tax=Aquabacter sp. L1I39 TaxID=2820278 RepID=UPI001FFCD95A|nr:methyltransferase [Aquabacter sp. L1I39]
MTVPDGLTRDLVLGGRLALLQPARGHRVGHDAMLLAASAPAGARRLVDLGAGIGSAGLAALARLPEATGHLVEIAPELAALARLNAEQNGLGDRCAVTVADADLLGRPAGPAGFVEAFDLVLSNPPFNAAAAHQPSPRPGRALAHMAGEGLLARWITAAYRCLEPGGMLVLILRPEDLQTLLEGLAGRFGALELMGVHATPDAPAVRLLARARKGRRTPPALLPPAVLGGAGGESGLARAVLRDLQPLPFP